MVDNIYDDDKKLFGYFASIKKINLKSIKYFKNPIVVNNLKKKISLPNFTKKEIVEINRDEMEIILDCEKLIAEKPLYLSDLTINYEEFITNIIEITYKMLNRNHKIKQLAIEEFIKIVEDNLNNFKIKTSIEDIKKFYSRNVWKLNYRHVPSRNPDKNMPLYDKLGKSKNFGYIVFDHQEK